MKSDLTLLSECLGETALHADTREAFERMHRELDLGRYRALSKKQREWALRVHAALGLDPGAENLVTSGEVKPTRAERESLRQMVDSLGPRPLKPPGQRTT
jgi:hypothetical protein